jgi:F-type H+-transporting ATPase subunit a
VAMHPMEQFEVNPVFDHPLLVLGGHPIYLTNQAVMMFVVIGVASLFFTLPFAKKRLVPTRVQSMAEVTYEMIQNMVDSNMGRDGLKFFPFILTLFLFIIFSNFLGLIPYTFTVTSQIAVTFALAVFVNVMMIVVGFYKHGLGFFKLFVPHAPWMMLPLLVPIEVISFLTRPISLSVRLFANMLAGHTMLQVFAGFVVMLGGTASVLAILTVPTMALIIAIYMLEMLVAFLQAYVFTILTCIYLNEGLHLHESH